MTTKYIEIDSTYRDRTVWPMQAEFQIQQAPRSSSSSMDSVPNSTPTISWQSNRFITSMNSVNVSGIVSESVADNGITTVVFVASNLQPDLNYYRGARYTSTTGNNYTVLSYRILSGGRGEITISTNVSETIGGAITITDTTNLASLQVFLPTGENVDNFYVGWILYDETLDLSTSITSYSGSTSMLTVDSAIPGWTATDSFSVRREEPLLVSIAVSATANTVELAPNTLNVNLVGSYIRVRPVYPANPNSFYTRIVAYDPVTYIATVNPPFVSPPIGQVVEVLYYSYDNSSPMIFNGTTQNEYINCNIRLLNLMIPNKILSVGYGGTIQNYPYIYVHLSAVNESYYSTITSNNPNSVLALFRATRIPYFVHDEDKFITFTGDWASQPVRFKVQSNYNFKVTLPSGDIIQFVEQDSTNPIRPNPLLQISGLFEVTRSPTHEGLA